MPSKTGQKSSAALAKALRVTGTPDPYAPPPPLTFDEMTPNQLLSLDMLSWREDKFTDHVVHKAFGVIPGWLAYHTWNSQHSQAGFPDVVALGVRNGWALLVLAELKTERGTVSLAQRAWLQALTTFAQIANTAAVRAGARFRVVVKVWRPRDWDEIVRLASWEVQQDGEGEWTWTS